MADDQKQNQIDITRQVQNPKAIISRIKQRAIKRARQYTMKDLNTLRHLPSYREMPTNIISDPANLIRAGLGLHTTSKGGFTLQYKTRQVQIKLGKVIPGYENFCNLVPRHRRTDKHPHTPNMNEINKLSKRNFDARVKRWKKAIHEWDEITLESQIPPELLPKPVKTNIAHISPHRFSPRSPPKKSRYKWSPKRKITPKTTPKRRVTMTRTTSPRLRSRSSEKMMLGIAAYIGAEDGIQLFFDDEDEDDDDRKDREDLDARQVSYGYYDDEVVRRDSHKAVYSPTRKAWYKPRRDGI